MQMVHEIVHFLFGNILMATLTLTAIGLIMAGIYDYNESTPAACARRRREMAEASAQSKIDEAKMQRDRELEQARLRLNRSLQESRNHAEDTRLAAQLFAAEVQRIQDEWRRQSGGDHE